MGTALIVVIEIVIFVALVLAFSFAGTLAGETRAIRSLDRLPLSVWVALWWFLLPGIALLVLNLAVWPFLPH